MVTVVRGKASGVEKGTDTTPTRNGAVTARASVPSSLRAFGSITRRLSIGAVIFPRYARAMTLWRLAR